MIEAQALSERTDALLARRAFEAVEETAPASTWAEDLRFFGLCYLAGFLFFLVMLT